MGPAPPATANDAVFTLPSELDPVIGVGVLHRYIPVPGDLIDLDGSFELWAAVYLKQKPAALRKRRVVKIPIGKEPVRVSGHHEHLTIARWEFPKLIEFFVFIR